jgi:hypothetical protein
MAPHRLTSLLFLLLALTAPPASAAGPVRPADALAPGAFRWLNDGPVAGPVYMIISIQRQMIHVYDGDRLIGMASVSTGKPGHSTPKGDFGILQKARFHRSNKYSNAPMPFMQRLTWDGVALHAGHNPGYPASHGCIRLPYAFAQQLFALTRIGTPVEVTADRLTPMLRLDPLVASDPGAAIMAFTPRRDAPVARIDPAATPAPAMPPPSGEERGAPYLDVDPGIFIMLRHR